MKHSKSTLFLMELIIAILFFALASTVCIRLFSKSHLLSKQTVNQNQAIIQVQNLADIFLAADGDPQKMEDILSHAQYLEETASFTLHFDKDWNAVQDHMEAAYSIVLKLLPEDDKNLISAKIDVVSAHSTSNEGTSLYDLTIKHHIPERRGNLEK